MSISVPPRAPARRAVPDVRRRSDPPRSVATTATATATRPAEATPPVPLRLVADATPRRCRGWRRAAKRALDVTIVVGALPVVVPVLLVVAAALKLVSRGPLLFRQHRIGLGGELFPMLKFRTMHLDSTERLRADPELWARYVANDFKLDLDEDPRLVPLGRLLRQTSLDELPQLLNVLRGEMSLVGPRPIVPGELALYGEWADAYLAVKPGLTGRWQTDGRNDIRYPERAMLDAEYVDSWRLRADLAILAKTLPCVLRRHGSS